MKNLGNTFAVKNEKIEKKKFKKNNHSERTRAKKMGEMGEEQRER